MRLAGQVWGGGNGGWYDPKFPRNKGHVETPSVCVVEPQRCLFVRVGRGMWNNSAPLNSSGAERSPPPQTGRNRPKGSEVIVGQTAYGTGFMLNARGSVIILHRVCVCV